VLTMWFSTMEELEVVKSRREVRFVSRVEKVREVVGEAREVCWEGGKGIGGAQPGEGGVDLELAGAGDGEAGAAEFETGFGDGVANAYVQGVVSGGEEVKCESQWSGRSLSQ
jgi:hypothetical protein